MAIEIHEKVTLWKKYIFKDDTDINEIIELLKKDGTLDNVIGEDLGFLEAAEVEDTLSFIQPCDNNGESTIEVIKNDEIIWKN